MDSNDFGSSVEGWYNPWGFITGSEQIMHWFFGALLNNNTGLTINYRRLGEIVKITKENIINHGNIYTYNYDDRWLLFSMNILVTQKCPCLYQHPKDKRI